jgi:EAL domain-containing protein (putative c-di-GMP-specific phosphodiesterase class I)
MGCRLIAEGIESDAQLKALREGGCHWGQGHWLGPLLERSDLARALGYEEEVPPDAGHTPG